MLTLETYVPYADPPDEYDQAIIFLLTQKRDNPNFWGQVVRSAWVLNNQGAPLFKRVDHLSELRLRSPSADQDRCGCLTQIRDRGADWWIAYNGYRNGAYRDQEALMKEIAADERLPSGPGGVTVDLLPVFAEWQRKIDRHLRIPYRQEQEQKQAV